MLFNSIEFALFLPIVFALYWFVFNRNIKLQNALILVSSYFFYGWWDWRFLLLISFSTVVDFVVGKQLHKEGIRSKRKLLLWLSLLTNLGLLGFFKYYNFFIDNFVEAFTFMGRDINILSISIILPVGISFYTFQTLSYTIDIYRKKNRPTSDFVAFCAFVSFFPQLVAGPIERATNLLPQFFEKRKFDYTKAADGLRQILWGLFKKVVIADNCAEFANQIFNNSTSYNGSTLMIGAVFFAFQIYGDFSGYSDIAIGTSRLFGFNLMRNFNFPYFSRDIAEFWRKWHISLSTWFRDYLYIPLGGSSGSTSKKIRNTFIVFIVSGFWHGANWTYVVWGLLNALLFLPLLLSGKNRNHLDTVSKGQIIPGIRELSSMGLTFFCTTIAWIFFRAESLSHAFQYLSEIFSSSFLSIPEVRPSNITILLCLFILMEWLGRHNQFAIEKLGLNWKRVFRYGLYTALSMLILYHSGKDQEFIYFQF